MKLNISKFMWVSCNMYFFIKFMFYRKMVEVIYMLGYGGQWVNNTSKFIGGVQTWVSIDVKINYIRFTDVACSRLGIN